MSNLVTPECDLLLPHYGELERERAPQPQRPLPVVLITLPAGADLPSWLEQCAVYDEQINHVNEGWSSDPDSHLVTLITYPSLRYVRGVTWVYIAWRGVIICRHQAADVSLVELEHLRTMDAVMASGMRLGQPYLWVNAAFQHTPRWLAPQPHRDVRYGRVSNFRDMQEPVWS